MKSSDLPARFIRALLSAPSAATLLIAICGIGAVRSQTLSNIDRDRARGMLSVIKSDLKKNYYDPAMHGMDIDTRFKAADEKLIQATSNGQLFSIIAQAVVELNDSHTFFIPPQRASRTEYGWQMQMVGEQCYVTAIKMPEFDLSQERVDDMMNKVRKYKALVLDLRGNPGGSETTLLRLVGDLFDHDVKVGDLKRRKEGKPIVAKTRGSHAFDGKVIVLIDHESGSAAELFARIVQLEKRGIVIGDRTAGAVMRSQVYNHQLGADTVVFYGLSITDADIVMTDGKSLEHVGVTPDELLLPAPADLAARRDPVLSRAAALAGVRLEPDKAGAMFPVEWRK